MQDDIIALKAKADALQKEFIDLVAKDAEAFVPVSKAYGMPTETDEQKAEKARVMEAALNVACGVPMTIMEKCCEAIELHKEFAAKGTAIAISDVGVGVICCRSALLGASLNVFINTKSMKNREHAEALNKKAEDMIQKYTAMADEIFADVRGRFNA